MFLARARTRNARCEGERSNHETTALPNFLEVQVTLMLRHHVVEDEVGLAYTYATLE